MFILKYAGAGAPRMFVVPRGETLIGDKFIRDAILVVRFDR
jgi:hypothetical protein